MSDRNPQLDGLRGIAILLVIPFHANTWLPEWMRPVVSGGWAGVDVFFVLSGFLITRILLRTRGQPGYWLGFIDRRVRRIFPLYFVVLALVGTIRALGLDQGDAAPWWMYVTFTSNWWQATHGVGTRLLRVTWSLACEEQFYLVWPWVVRWASREALAALAVVALVAAPVLRLAFHGTDAAEYLLPMRMDPIAAGALLALVQPPRWAWAVWLAGAVALVGLGDAHAAVTVAAAAAIVAAERGALPWLAWRPLVLCGTISYALYLLHLPCLHWCGLTGIALAFVLAGLSWVLLEEPILTARR